MTISVGDIFGTFIQFKEENLKIQAKNREIPFKYGDLAIFDNIGPLPKYGDSLFMWES